MRKVLTAFVGILLVFGLAIAQEKAKQEKTTEMKVSGEIVAIDQAKSTITIKKAGGEMHVITFNETTKWTRQEKDKVLDVKREEFKVGERVICMVAMEGGKMVAYRIDLRKPEF